MIDAVSPAVMKSLPFGKYVRWAESLSADTLESLLWVIGVYGTEYWALTQKTGAIPKPTFAAHQRGDFRGVGAMRYLAQIFRGTFLPRANWFPDGRTDTSPRIFSPEYYASFGARHGLDHRAPAFAREFLARLEKADPLLGWSAELSEVEFHCLLWLVGEFGMRTHIAIGQDPSGYSTPTFERTTPQIERMCRCLEIIRSIERGAGMDSAATKRRLLGAV